MIPVTCGCGHQFEEPDYMRRRTTVCEKYGTAIRVTVLGKPQIVRSEPLSEDERLRRIAPGSLALLLTAMITFPVSS